MPAIMLAKPRPLNTPSGNCDAWVIASRQLFGLKKGKIPSITNTSASAGIMCSHIDYFLPDGCLPEGSLK